jgi:hypothetical protein
MFHILEKADFYVSNHRTEFRKKKIDTMLFLPQNSTLNRTRVVDRFWKKSGQKQPYVVITRVLYTYTVYAGEAGDAGLAGLLYFNCG